MLDQMKRRNVDLVFLHSNADESVIVLNESDRTMAAGFHKYFAGHDQQKLHDDPAGFRRQACYEGVSQDSFFMQNYFPIDPVNGLMHNGALFAFVCCAMMADTRDLRIGARREGNFKWNFDGDTLVIDAWPEGMYR